MPDEQFDVIVVGAGGSGLAAGYSAVQHGGRVLILEKRPSPGGTTGIAVGSFTAAGTRFQRAAGIQDNAADHAIDAAKFAKADIEQRNHQPLRDYFLREAAKTLEWLDELGLSFVGPHPEPPNRVPRMHNVVPGAKAYILALRMALQKANARLVCHAVVTELLVNPDGRVGGVRALVRGEPTEFHAARGVILAAGDYANNPEMISRAKQRDYRDIEGINPYATGDGHVLAEQAGGALVNIDITYRRELRFVPPARDPFRQWLPSGPAASRMLGALARGIPRFLMNALIKRLLVTWQHPEDALFEDGAILVNKEGRRFVNERKSPEREIAVAAQPEKIAYLVLDRRLVRRYSAWPHFVSTAPDIAYAYVKDYLKLRSDIALQAASPEKLAARRNLNPSQLIQSIEQFNEAIDLQQPDPFGRSGDTCRLAEGPWVLLGPLKSYFTTTEGGADVNHSLQVLDRAGNPINGLFAVGQNGLGGMVLWGHGLHIAWALTSGRLAGQRVMELPEKGQHEPA